MGGKAGGAKSEFRRERDIEIQEIGDILKRRRAELGINQIQMAARIGTDQSEVSRVERGNRVPADLAKLMAYAFCYRLDEKETIKWCKAAFGLYILEGLTREQRSVALLAIAMQLAKGSWVRPMPILHEIVRLSGDISTNTSAALLLEATLLMNLGAYKQAKALISHIGQAHGTPLDFARELELCELRGVLDYYLGDYESAEEHLKRCLHLREEGGAYDRALGAPHFLARVYLDWGVQYSQEQRRTAASEMFRRSHLAFEMMRPIRRQYGTDIDQAFDLVREAQLLAVEGRGLAAKDLRIEAKRIFAGDEHAMIVHIDLEEARLGLENSDPTERRRKAQKALEWSADIKYARGIASSLSILGELEENPERAIGHLLAALFVNPSPSEGRLLWPKITRQFTQIMRVQSPSAQRDWMQRFREAVEYRNEEFYYLDCISVERDEEIERIVRRLESMVGLQPDNLKLDEW